MGESLTQVLVKAYEGLATTDDVRCYLNQLSSQKETLNITWQTIEAFKLSLNSFTNSTEPDEELLDVLFDGFNYIIENSCSDESWSSFGFELSNLTLRFLSVLEKTQQFEHFFCKLLTAVSNICNHDIDVWRSVSRQLLNLFINKKFSSTYFQDAVKLYILILRSVDDSERQNFALKNLELLKNFSYMMQSVGDFESQSCILEVVFLHIIDKKTLADDFFIGKNKNVAERFRNLTFEKFEADCRIFINEINENLGSEKNVFTISCNQFIVGGKRLIPSEDDACIWLDVNCGSRRLSITCSPFYESETFSAGGRCMIFIPECNFIDFRSKFGESSGENCYFFEMFFKDLKSSHQDLTSDNAICTALHSSNSKTSIQDFKTALDSFAKIRGGETEGELVVDVGADKKNEIGESDELFMPVVKKAQKQPDFSKDLAAEKKLQDNVISSSNLKIMTSALDLFKEDETEKKQKKSYGISVGGGGITDSLAVSRTPEEARHSPVPRLQNPPSSSESSPVNLNRRLRKTLSSDESSSPRKRAGKGKGREPRTNKSPSFRSSQVEKEDPSLPPKKNLKNSFPPSSGESSSSPRRSTRFKNTVNYSELLDKEQKCSDKESPSNEKKGKKRGRKPSKNQIFCSEEYACQSFNEGPSPVERAALRVPPKKYLENSSGRQKRSTGEMRKSPKKEEIKNTSLLDPDGYAYKRWSGGETSKRGQFWLDKLKKLESKKETGADSVFDFSDDESKYFKKKSAPKSRKSSSAPKNKRNSSIKTVVAKVEKIKIKKTPPKSSIKNVEGKVGTCQAEIKKETTKRRSGRKTPASRPALKITKAKKTTGKKVEEKTDSEKDIAEILFEDLMNDSEVIENTQPDLIQEQTVEEPEKSTTGSKSGKSSQGKKPKKVIKEPEPEEVFEEMEPEVLRKSPKEPKPKAPELKVQEKVFQEPEPEFFKDPEPEKNFEEPEPEFFKDPEPEKNFEEPEPENNFMETEPEKYFEELEPEKIIEKPQRVYEEDPEITFGDSKLEESPQEPEVNRFEGIQTLGKNLPIEKDNDGTIIVKEVGLNSEVDPNLPFVCCQTDANGQYKCFQTNSRAIWEKFRRMEEKENEAPTSSGITKGTEQGNEIPNPAANSKEIPAPIGNRKENEIPTPIKNQKEKTPVSSVYKKRPASSSDEISTSPLFSVKSKINYPISRNARYFKKRRSQKRKSLPKKESSSSDESSAQSPPKIVTRSKSPPKLVMKPITRPKVLAESPKSTKRKFKESSEEECSDPASPPFISSLRERNRQKTKLQTDRIVQTVNNGMSECLKSIYKKKSKTKDEFSSYVGKIIPENSHEVEFEKRFNRLERCVTYFQNGCAVTELCEDMEESISKVQECVAEISSDELNLVEEKKIETFTTRLEGIIKCQTKTELQNQLQTMANKMFNILSLDM